MGADVDCAAIDALQKELHAAYSENKILKQKMIHAMLVSSNIAHLAQLSLENFEDDIEEKPMRHSLGNLIARLRATLTFMDNDEITNEFIQKARETLLKVKGSDNLGEAAVELLKMLPAK